MKAGAGGCSGSCRKRSRGRRPPRMHQYPKRTGTKALPRNAYLVLQGTRVIPLNRPLIKIGRQLDNHIILEDPRVSRSHAQIKLINDRFVIFDMNSTGGTFVNGQPISQSVLYPGDVISLAGVVFIFSQEMPARPGDMKIIELGSPFAADRPTAIVHREEIKPAKEIRTKRPARFAEDGPVEIILIYWNQIISPHSSASMTTGSTIAWRKGCPSARLTAKAVSAYSGPSNASPKRTGVNGM